MHEWTIKSWFKKYTKYKRYIKIKIKTNTWLLCYLFLNEPDKEVADNDENNKDLCVIFSEKLFSIL